MGELIKYNKMKNVYPIFIIMGLFSLLVGVTYAFANKSIVLNGTNSIESGMISMSYTETSSVITLDNALPMSDSEGIVLDEYFDFSVTSSTAIDAKTSIDMNYDIILEPLDIDEGYSSLSDNEIKIYLENKDTNSILVNPTLISNLTSSGSNRILLSTTHTHNGSKTITTNYRLRVWIDAGVSIEKFKEKSYEYKFRININGEGDSVKKKVLKDATSGSCFEYVSDGNGGVIVANYICDDASIQKTSSSLSNNYISTMPNYLNSNNNSTLANEVITDVVIPEEVTMSPVIYPTQSDLTNSDKKECATWFTETVEGLSSGDSDYNTTYQGYYTMCSGGIYNSMTLELFRNKYLSMFETYYPSVNNLKVFTKSYLPLGTYEVTGIGDYAFYDKDLTSVKISDSVIKIGKYAFWYNDGITSLDLGNSVKIIDSGAFCQNKIKDIVIPDSVTTIGYIAFYANMATSLTLGSSVTTIDNEAFELNNITSVTIPNSVTFIGEAAFFGNKLDSITIPSSITSIEKGVFYGNGLTSVTIPNSVTKIDAEAFSNNKLTSVTIPNSVTSIGTKAFYANELTNVTIPNSVETICSSAFSINKLTSVTIPNSVTTIDAYAFEYNNLTNVTIPSSVTKLGNGVFKFNNLDYVVLESNSNLSEIGEYAFSSSSDTQWEYVNNPNLNTIYNNTGKSFNWSSIINGNGSNTFVTGNLDGIIVITGSPS